MKKLERFKTAQLFIFMFMALLCFYLIVIRSNVYHLIAESKELQLVCILLWATLFTAFFFVFMDLFMYSKQKIKFNALDYAANSDSLTSIANRQGIDEIIDKYVDAPLTSEMGCAMFLLTSLNEINKNHSRAEGNAHIRNFSVILKLASTDICFVGRNGGNVFLAIFEKTSREIMEGFMDRIATKVAEYNKKNTLPMVYESGMAYIDDIENPTINGLISLANKRARKNLGGVAPAPAPAVTSTETELKNAVFVESKTINTKATEAKDSPAPKKSFVTRVAEERIRNHEKQLSKFATVAKLVEAEVVTEVKRPEEPVMDTKKQPEVITLSEDDYRYSDSEIFNDKKEDFRDYYKEAI